MSGYGDRTNAVLARAAAGGRLTRDGDGWRQDGAAVAAAAVDALVAGECLAVDARGARVTEVGRAAAERLADPDAPNRWLVRRGNAGKAPLMVNLAESPLGWLFRRGLIGERQFAAGERLRADHALAHRPPSVTMRWDGAGGGGGGGPRTPADPTLAHLAARARVEAALAAVGPGLADIARRVVCEGEGLEVAERAMSWPARAGKVVLGLALDRLAEHYRV